MRYIIACTIFALAGYCAYEGEMFLSMLLLSASIATALWKVLIHDT